MADMAHLEPNPDDMLRNERLASLAVALLLLIACFLIVRPFLSAALWGAVLCASTWKLFRRLDRALGNRRTIAALIMTLALTAAIVAPFTLVGFSLVDEVKATAGVLKQALEKEPSVVPIWLAKIPVVGPQLSQTYHDVIGDELTLVEQAKKLSGPVGRRVLQWSAAFGRGLWELLLSLLIGFFFYRDGESLGQRISNLTARVAGRDRGVRLLKLAQETCVGVVYGIVGTGLIQAVGMALAMLLAGVPGALVLGFVTFLVSALPGGPAVIWIPSCIWLYSQDHTGWAIALVVWSLIFNFLVDSVLRPILIAESGDVPLLLVFIGIFGGAAAFGFLGVFLGPALLAVGYSLLDDVTTPSATAPLKTGEQTN